MRRKRTEEGEDLREKRKKREDRGGKEGGRGRGGKGREGAPDCSRSLLCLTRSHLAGLLCRRALTKLRPLGKIKETKRDWY